MGLRASPGDPAPAASRAVGSSLAGRHRRRPACRREVCRRSARDAGRWGKRSTLPGVGAGRGSAANRRCRATGDSLRRFAPVPGRRQQEV